MPKILVLLATYNGRLWLPEQCGSILNQAGVEVELLASDDGSSDGSQDYLQGLAERDPRVHLMPPTSRAGSAGRNFYRLIRDADLADHDFVAFSDQDDVWHLDKLARASAALDAGGAAGYSSAVRAVYPNGKTHLLSQSPATTPVDFLFEGAGQGCTFLMNRALFERVQRVVRQAWGQVSEVHHHDWLVYALCRSSGMRWHFDPVPSMEYRQHDSNELGGRGSVGGIVKRWGMLRSGWYARQVDAVSAAIVASGNGAAIATFLRQRRVPGSLSSRLGWIAMVCRVGRRKRGDRLVLGLASTFGYL